MEGRPRLAMIVATVRYGTIYLAPWRAEQVDTYPAFDSYDENTGRGHLGYLTTSFFFLFSFLFFFWGGG